MPLLEVESTYQTDVHRRLCIKKDIAELNQWIDTLSEVNSEIEQLKLIEKQLLVNRSIEYNLRGLQRKNTLVVGMLCRYEQDLKTEFEYGKGKYDHVRAKEHETKRDAYCALIGDFKKLKQIIYKNLTKYRRQ